MSMKEITLDGKSTSEAPEVLVSNNITATEITIQNRTQGPIYLWADASFPTKADSGFLIKSGDFYTLKRIVGSKLFITGLGTVVVQY